MFRQCGNIVATSTLAIPTDLTTVRRKQKDGTRIDVECPRSVALYNQYVGGVDLSDQLCGSYHVRLKCRKKYKYIFCLLFDVAVTNALVLRSFDVQSGAAMEQKKFQLKLAEQLIGSYQSRK